MAIRLDSIDQQKNLKILDEKETRKRLLAQAKIFGIEHDLVVILDKYDNLMKKCTDEKEKKDIGKLGAFEVYNLFNRGGELYVDGNLVYKTKE